VKRFCPQGPDWTLDWAAIDARYAWVRLLRECEQNPTYHREGNVWIHTRMVCSALVENSIWRALPEAERELVFVAALCHDIAKPACTRSEPDGSISARGHSSRGALMTRRLLWEMDFPFEQREQIVNMVRYHQIPFWILDRDNPERMVSRISWNTRCDHLALLAEADIRGRICDDADEILERIELFRLLAEEQNCLRGPRIFPTEFARFCYLNGHRDYADEAPYEDFSCEVFLLSGLPAAGKDHWVTHEKPGYPVISLDMVREQLGIRPEKPQGPVVSAAKAQAKTYLRAHQSFIWNATNTTRSMRSQLIELFHGYRARVTLVYVESPRSLLFKGNRERERSVPEVVIDRLLNRWEVPDPYEAHAICYALRHCP